MKKKSISESIKFGFHIDEKFDSRVFKSVNIRTDSNNTQEERVWLRYTKNRVLRGNGLSPDPEIEKKSLL